MFKKIISALLCVMLIASSVALVSAADTSVSSTGTDTQYTTAVEAIDADYAYDGTLGAIYSPERTVFKLWSPTATEVTLNRYATGSDAETGAQDLGTVPLEKLMDGENWTGVWTCTVEGDIVNTYYTYSVTTTDVLGTNKKTYETQDVYSQATGVNGQRSMVVDLSKTNPDGWASDSHVVVDKQSDSYVWEVHVKDFSYAESSGVSAQNRGKYMAFTETGTTVNGEGNVSTCIDYLKNLGVTTVQINPFYDFGSINETGSDSQFNWGYDPMNYNVPEGSYSSNPYDGNVRIKECKAMIQALHNAGISVVMDVVYNHTYSTDSCFTHTVPMYYYRMNANGSYASASGCGNDTASERAMFRRYMIDSCRYWVDEYHVDGFRFDLMGLHDAETMNLIRADLDQVDPRLTMWGEGWTMGSNFPTKTCAGTNLVPASQANSSQVNSRIGFFSDEIRDGLKGSVFSKKGMGWLQGVGGSVNTMLANIQANPSNIGASRPTNVVQYSSCHDNQTLWDRLADSQGYTDFRAREELLVKQSKLTAAYLNTVQGITFTLAGEEMGRSKDNDENSYKSSATLNMIDWTLLETNGDIVSYYSGMREIREKFSPFTSDTAYSKIWMKAINPVYKKVGVADVLSDSDGYAAVWTNTTEGEWNKVAVLTNNKKEDVEYTLDNAISEWVIIANNEQAGIKNIGEVTDNHFTIPAHSAIVAVDKASFNSVAYTSDRGTVYVEKENTINHTTERMVLTGKIGTGYSLKADGIQYELNVVEGSTSGVFTAADQTVRFKVLNFIPDSVKDIDLNGDHKSNINDATELQLVIAGKKTMDDATLDKADVTLDGKRNINDVTMIQRYIAEMFVGAGTVTLNYYDQDDKKITKSTVIKGRVGDVVSVAPASISKYELNVSKSYSDTSAKVPYGNVEINYYYDFVFEGNPVTVNIKNDAPLNYVPCVWIWGTYNGADSGNYTIKGSWPGDALELYGDWYSKTFTVDKNDDCYNLVLSNNGEDQTGDIKGLTPSEIWVVYTGKSSVNIYDVNPDDNPTAEPIKQG